jgi:uncharacterized protein (TIGR02058 family)
MTRKRFAIELGTGADLHGADMTKAAVKAVKDAISRTCLCGLVEICGRGAFEGVYVHAVVGVPDPGAVDAAPVLAAIPIGEKTLEVVGGGLRAPGIEVPCFGPGASDIVMACAALTVSLDMADGPAEAAGAATSSRCLAGKP